MKGWQILNAISLMVFRTVNGTTSHHNLDVQKLNNFR